MSGKDVVVVAENSKALSVDDFRVIWQIDGIYGAPRMEDARLAERLEFAAQRIRSDKA
jgi:hypothetical protein